MLGRQDFDVGRDGVKSIFDAEQFLSRLPFDRWDEEGGNIAPESFFRALGFSEVESLDLEEAGASSIAFDLNSAATPEALLARFDVIYDGGTLEHVFHVPNALARCAEMLKPNGVIVHCVPMNNYVDHGFHQFSPTFWFDWFASNGWVPLESVMVRLPSSHREGPSCWTFSHLPPGKLGTIGQLDEAPYMHYIVARKGPNASGDQIPWQAYYSKKYADADRADVGLRQFDDYSVTQGIRTPVVREPAAHLEQAPASQNPVSGAAKGRGWVARIATWLSREG